MSSTPASLVNGVLCIGDTWGAYVHVIHGGRIFVQYCSFKFDGFMTPSGLAVELRKSAKATHWESFCRYLNQYFSTSPSQERVNPPAHRSASQSAELRTDQSHQPTDDEILQTTLQALHDGDFQLRWELSKIIPNFGGRAIAPLISLLDEAEDDDDWELSWFIARILGHYPTDQSITALQQLLQSTSQDDIRSVVIDALASMGETAIPTLAGLVHHVSTRLSAVQALAQIQHSEVATILMSVAQDEDEHVRAVAIATLGHWHQPNITQLLIQSLSDPASAVRRAAVVGLGLQHRMLSEEECLEVLTPLLWDINLEVRRQVIFALGRLTTPHAADRLFMTLCSADTPPMLWGDILRTLVWTETLVALHHLRTLVNAIQKPPPARLHSREHSTDVSALSLSLSAHFSNDRPAQLQFFQTLATTLGLVEPEPLRAIAADILMTMLATLHLPNVPLKPSERSNIVAITQAAIHSLGHLRQPSSVDYLQTMLDTETDKSIQIHLVRAIEKLQGIQQSSSNSHEM
jgi:HEAT repeat protein